MKKVISKKTSKKSKFDIEKEVIEIKQRLTKTLTKDDAKNFVTKEDLEGFATKEDLKGFATKEDLKSMIGDIALLIETFTRDQ